MSTAWKIVLFVGGVAASWFIWQQLDSLSGESSTVLPGTVPQPAGTPGNAQPSPAAPLPVIPAMSTGDGSFAKPPSPIAIALTPSPIAKVTASKLAVHNGGF